MSRRAAQPCEVCGTPTTSSYGVCQRTIACKNEVTRRVKVRTSDVRSPCEVCGEPTWGYNSVCARTPACRAEKGRRTRAAEGPEILRLRHSRYYEANAEALREQKRQEYAADPDEMRQRRKDRYQRNRDREREQSRRWRAENLDQALKSARDAARRYRSRADRPCRYAAAGCPDFALPGQSACRDHANADRKRRYERRRDKLIARLAETQGGICTWCGKPLPADLTERLAENRMAVEVDHVIPKDASLRLLGCVIEDDWNLRALHWSCNGAAGKYRHLTPEAVALAAEHGIALDWSGRSAG